MRTQKMRLVSALLAIAMLFALVPVGAFAASGQEETLYTDGDYQFELVTDENGETTATIRKYTGSNTSITIPATVSKDGVKYAVTAIKGSDKGYQNYVNRSINADLVSVTIPSSIKNIGEDAFVECNSLEEVKFTENSALERIGMVAFCGCEKLKNIELPEGLKTIGAGAFAECESFSKIVLPSTVTTLEREAFEGCKKLQEIELSEDLETIEMAAFVDCALTSITIPKNVKKIGVQAFGMESGASYSLETVTLLGNPMMDYGAFYECNQIETVNHNVTEKEWDAFKNGTTDGMENIVETDEGYEYSNPIKSNPNITHNFVREVSFDLNGHGGAAAPATVRIPYDEETLAKQDIPTYADSDYDFVGWGETPESTTPFDQTRKIAKDTTLYAIWKQKEKPAKPESTPAEPAKYTLTVNGADVVTDENGSDLMQNPQVAEGTAVKISAPETDLSGMVFSRWVVDEPDGLELSGGFDRTKYATRFTMPNRNVTLHAEYVTPDQTGQDDDAFSTAAAVVGGAALTGLVAWQGYNLFAEVYMKQIWPILPENRVELALALWHDAGEPAASDAALYTDIGEDDADAQAAARWAVENELLKPADKNDANLFKPYKALTPGQVYRAWKKAQEWKR